MKIERFKPPEEAKKEEKKETKETPPELTEEIQRIESELEQFGKKLHDNTPLQEFKRELSIAEGIKDPKVRHEEIKDLLKAQGKHIGGRFMV